MKRDRKFYFVSKCVLNIKIVLKLVLVKICVLQILTFKNMRIHYAYLT